MSNKPNAGLVDQLHYFLAHGLWQIDASARPLVQRPFLHLLRCASNRRCDE